MALKKVTIRGLMKQVEEQMFGNPKYSVKKYSQANWYRSEQKMKNDQLSSTFKNKNAFIPVFIRLVVATTTP